MCFSSYSPSLGELTLDETHLETVQHHNPEAVIHHYSARFPRHSCAPFVYILFTTGKTAVTSLVSQKKFVLTIWLFSSHLRVYLGLLVLCISLYSSCLFNGKSCSLVSIIGVL